MVHRYTFSLLVTLLSSSCKTAKFEEPENFYFTEYSIDGKIGNFAAFDAPLNPVLKVRFSVPVHASSATSAFRLSTEGHEIALRLVNSDNDSTILVSPAESLSYFTRYKFEVLPSLLSKKNTPFKSNIEATFLTKPDSTDKFPRISDEQLLTLIQKQTFRYFWDFAHPVSGLARERDSSGDLVTSGGSGFGIMAIPVAIKRGFINHSEGLNRMLKITDFLLNKTVTYHGAFPHWLSGQTGATIAFSTKDNGGDLVETSFLMMGLLAARNFFDGDSEQETELRKQITTLWENVEWDWYTKGGENVLYWHWSPDYQWEMNHPISGWNEALITYILAVASPTHAIEKSVYDTGWARNGAMRNKGTFYGYELPLGPNLGGPLFFEHYTFLGIDPRNLKDQYADYWVQARNHSLINHAYCIDNPKGIYGYSRDCWGLTASDTYGGYSAHSPTNDTGIITPTAALSSFPFTPEESMKAAHFFYYKLGDRLFRQYGFADAFSLQIPWFANSFLAIDQGPIIGMIENYRSGLLWELTMKDPDIRRGLNKLGFTF